MGSACGAEAQVQPHSPVRALADELAALTREVAGLRSLEFEPNDPKSWQQTATVQDFVQNPVLTQLRKGDPSLGDPSILEVSGCYHLFVPCAKGILHLSSKDGLSNWNTSELAVSVPGAVGPFVRLLEGVVHLFYEQRGESAFQPASIFLKTAPVLEESKAWQWSEPRQVLEPQLEWEKVGKSRVGNPFVVYDEKAVRWLLYYSASLTFLTDARIDDPQPLFIGLAEAPAAEGPYRRLQETPLFRTASDVHPQIIGAGSFKIIQGFDTLSRRDSSYDALDHGSPRKLLALQSRLTRTALGITGSSFALLASEDGLSWDVLDAHFLTPLQRPGWNVDYMLSFDTLMPSDANHVFLYYHAREGQPGSSGGVGVSRIQRSFLEELSCSQATRVRA